MNGKGAIPSAGSILWGTGTPPRRDAADAVPASQADEK